MTASDCQIKSKTLDLGPIFFARLRRAGPKSGLWPVGRINGLPLPPPPLILTTASGELWALGEQPLLGRRGLLARSLHGPRLSGCDARVSVCFG